MRMNRKTHQGTEFLYEEIQRAVSANSLNHLKAVKKLVAELEREIAEAEEEIKAEAKTKS